MGTGRISVESQRAALRLAGKEKRSKATSLPLAARVSISNEIGTVLINGIISQVHADIILGKRHKCWGREEGQASHFLSVPSHGPWGLEMEKKGEAFSLI